jgi:DNA segregation ATPase FtsK/SpoIIIE, S-DNA-T family
MAKRNQQSELNDPAILKRLGWAFLAALLVFLTTAFVTYDPADPPGRAVWPLNENLGNACGRAGALIAHYGLEMLGSGVFVLLAGLFAYLAATAAKKPVTHPFMRALGILLMAIALGSTHALVAPSVSSFPEGGGGLLGITITHHLARHFGGIGAGFAIAAAAWIGAIVAFDRALAHIPRVGWPVIKLLAKGAWGLLRRLGRKAAEKRSQRRHRLNDLDDDDRLKHMPIRTGAAAAVAMAEEEDAEEEEAKPAGKKSGLKLRRKRKAQAARAVVEEAEEGEDEAAPELDREARAEVDRKALREKIAKLPIKHAGAAAADPTGADAPPEPPNVAGVGQSSGEQDLSGYQFPMLDVLVEPEGNFTERQRQFVLDQAQVLEEALVTYGIDGEVVGIDSGPVITMYEVKLAPGTKVANINTVSSDIARSMGAINIRIVTNIPGKTTVGIEVPNLDKEKVRLKELMLACTNASKMKLPMFLGKDASGAPITQDLTKMPHMLIAGTTGSGKSVCMNSIIMSFLFTKRPDELKLVLVDPKMVEMSQFRDIPHLMCPVVTEMGRATAILEWAVTKMDERYELLAEAGCRDIAAYNELGWDELKERLNPQTEEQEARIPLKLPYMVFIIDELADLMMTNKDVEPVIVRIAQKARAVGIHLILATQRPQANVVTGLIKSNMPCRVAFKVSSGMDSRIVLDQKGAELLLGQGDMLYLSPRSHELVRCQGTLVDDAEIRTVVKFLKSVATQTFERQLIQIKSSGAAAEHPEDDLEITGKINEKDPLFETAVELVIASGRGSVSMLQRSLSIGYTRASRLIEQMGQAGIIGEYKGSQARDVVMSQEEWDEMKQMIAEQERDGTLFAPQGTEAQDASVESEGGVAVAVADEAEDAEVLVDSDDEYDEWDLDDGEDDDLFDDDEDEDEDDEEDEDEDEDEDDEYLDDEDEDEDEDEEEEDEDEEEELLDEADSPTVYIENTRKPIRSDAPFDQADEIQ